MSRDPIRQAIESGDLCEAGRLYAKQLAEMEMPTPPHPMPPAATQPSQGGGVGSYEPNPPSDEEVRAAAEWKYPGITGSRHAA